MVKPHHTIIIGAGFSGIAAAAKLYKAGKPFLILEARERLGGRVHTQTLSSGATVDLGGQWIGPSQNRMYELIKEHGLSYFETYNEGKNILDLNGQMKHYVGLIPKMDVLSLINAQLFLMGMDLMAKKINLEQPWILHSAADKDQKTLGDFLDQYTFTKSSRAIIKAGLETVFASELNQISLLHALFYIKAGKDLNNLLNIKNGAQLHRIKGGMLQLAEKMAAPFKDNIKFNSAVTNIDVQNELITVSGNGFFYNSEYVIIAIPPTLSAEIKCNPPLTEPKISLLQKLPMGKVGKCFGIYKKPFWREKELSGQVVADDANPFQTFFDASPEDGSKGIILAFCIANRAEDFFSKPESERKEIALRSFMKYFGEEANNLQQYHDHYWADEKWSKGCYAAIYPPGIWTQYQDELRKPAGNIHWAGTETATEWYGYIEGAVRAGERAAAEILNK
jgi:monoamine oxidase